ncbi:MAG: M55 family metallopeptidase [Clostridiaceae bacterium]|jgi:D-amino peptidase|nr:M55 family metallopeptidase [Clostridiaceae bacterium]
MKIYIMTDMEGVAGVIDRQNYTLFDSRYYELGKELLTKEVNAAIEGFFEAGANEILVADGHGYGAINQLLLDPRVELIRGFPDPWPFGLDASFDAVAWVGQHAKASTPYAHLAHTGSHHVIDSSINGVSVGEFGQLAMCAASLGVRSIFGAGDKAFTKEAEALIKGIVTVAVKRGIKAGTGEECTFEEYKDRNIAAIHLHPEKARQLIREGAKKALSKFKADREAFELLDIKPPYKMITKYRPAGGKQGFTEIKEHPDSIIKMMNTKGRIMEKEYM